MKYTFQVGDIVRYHHPNGSIGRVEQVKHHANGTTVYVRYVYGLDVHGEPITSLGACSPFKLVIADEAVYDKVRLSSPAMWGPAKRGSPVGKLQACAVLLVPAQGDPLNLLGPGPLGDLPPTAEIIPFLGPRQRWRVRADGSAPTALILAWADKPSQEGLLRASTRALPPDFDGQVWPSAPSLAETLKNARLWEREGLGRVVLQDEGFNEIESI